MLKYINTTEFESIVKTNPENLFILEGKSMKTRTDLFSQIARVLYFPNYFGNNWNALDDCLQDLDWIHSDAIKILIRDFDEILSEENKKEKTIFLDCVKTANNFWEEEQEKKVDFYIQN
ncbi:MAG: barstar family protein [Treponema sp.]